MPQSTILEINTGRVASVRLGPNEDLVEALDQAAAHLGFRRALVRTGLGSLIDAAFVGAEGKPRRIEGPAVEPLSPSGEISQMTTASNRSAFRASSAIRRGRVGGPVRARAENPVCVT